MLLKRRWQVWSVDKQESKAAILCKLTYNRSQFWRCKIGIGRVPRTDRRLIWQENGNITCKYPNVVKLEQNPDYSAHPPVVIRRSRPEARLSNVPKLFGWDKSLCIFNKKTFKALKLGSYFTILYIWNILKEQLFTACGSQFLELLFGPDMLPGLSRNGPLLLNQSNLYCTPLCPSCPKVPAD